MTVQRVAKDVFTIFTQSELLRCRRSVSYVAGPPVHQQKASLIDELTLLSRDEGLRWRLYEHLLCGHRVADLRATFFVEASWLLGSEPLCSTRRSVENDRAHIGGGGFDWRRASDGQGRPIFKLRWRDLRRDGCVRVVG